MANWPWIFHELRNVMSTNETHYDVVVIGSGPGGEGASMNVTKLGHTVAVVERASQVGGNCTHVGTIPSKALRYVIFRLAESKKNPLFRQARVSLDFSYPQLRESAQSVVHKQVDMRSTFYERNHVPVIHGEARFVDAHTIEVIDGNGLERRITADGFIIATGARPYHPPDVDFSHPRIFDSDSILNMSFTPQSVTVYGAGVIGCEYASMLRNLELKVNLINSRAKLLEFLDDEIIDALAYHMRDLGILIRHREEYERVEGRDDGVVLYLKSGKQIKTDILLWANGRTGNTDRLGLQQIGITPDSRGQIPVDENYRTDVPNIYAVGDVIGYPALASAAYVQGRHAAARLVGGEDVRGRHEIPTGIYTSPEISSIGKNERELTEKNIPYEVGHAFFRSLARAQITGQTVGMLKLLFHRESLAILGVHCFGANAAEIVHIGQAIMAQPAPHNTLEYFLNTTFNYPTMAEAYRVAALNGYNRLF